MAERRMFTKKITDADEFISLPSSAQALYLHLTMAADDDGFNNQVQMAMFKAHASVDDVKILLAKRYIIQFENGVIVIKHWRMANALRKDRYTTTAYQEELKMLKIKDNGVYSLIDNGNVVDGRLPDGCQVVAPDKYSIDKDRLDKNSIDNNPPYPPLGEHDYGKHSNVFNYQHFKKTNEEEHVRFITNHADLDNCITSWMKYKDERKPKSSNHYAETGMGTLLKKIYKYSLDYGIEAVISLIEDSMSSNYQGIVWDRCKNITVKSDNELQAKLKKLENM